MIVDVSRDPDPTCPFCGGPLEAAALFLALTMSFVVCEPCRREGRIMESKRGSRR